jgi:MYXO-CTERM domain-containing protein
MKTITAIALVAGLATAASADVITSWVNFGQPGNQDSSAVGTAAANVSGIALTRGSGLSASSANNSFSSSGWDQGDGDDANDYFSFGFTVADGFSVNLESFWVGARASNTGPGFLGLYSSVDGFSTNLFTFTQSGTNFNNVIADVSALTGLTGTVEFRVLALNDISANGGTVASGGTFRFGDHFDGTNFTEMRFEGTVVPAPGAMALLGLGGLVATRRRR